MRGAGTELSKRLELLGQPWRPETVRRWLNGRSIPTNEAVRWLSEALAQGTRTSAVDIKQSLQAAVTGCNQAPDRMGPSPPAWLFPLPGHFVPRPELEASVWTALTAPVPAGSARIVAITGMTGVGKSTLARAVCCGSQATREFPGGVLWIDAGPETTAGITACQARILDHCGRSAVVRDRSSGLQAVRAALAGRRLLIALDDVWSAKQIRSLLPPDSGTALLITSRNDQAVFFGTQRVRVEPFGPGPDADVVLAYAMAPPGSVRVSALARITRVCAGLPLALAVAGSLVREATTHWGLSAEDAWEDVAERLEHMGITALEARFQDYPYPSLWAALEASATTLSRSDQERFTELAVLDGHGWVPVAAVHRLWRNEVRGVPECRAVLMAFARRALLDYDRTVDRIHVHDLVQEYLSNVCDERTTGDLHLRIAASYLDDWGGVAAGLPRLVEDVGNADAAYGVNRLIHHLVTAGALETAADVVASQSATGGRENVWLTVRERSGQIEQYLEDLSLVGEAAATRSDADIAAGRSAEWLVVELTCAALRASVMGKVANLPGPMAAALVRRGVWSINRALGYARGVPEPEPRAVMLSCLIPETAELDRPALAQEALDAARLIGSPGLALSVLAALAPWLPNELDDEVPWILARTHPGHWPGLRLHFTAVLAAHLTPAFIANQISLAEAGSASGKPVDLEPGTADFITAVAPFAPPASRSSLLRQARALTIPYRRLRALAAVHDVLPASQRRHVVKDLIDIALSAKGLITDLDLVLSRLPGDRRDIVVRDLLERSRTLDHPDNRLFCLRQLGDDLRGEVAIEIADVFRSWKEPSWSAAASLMEYLDEAQRQRVLNGFLDERPGSWPADDTETLVELAPYAADDLFGRAVGEINRDRDLDRRCGRLMRIVGRLPVPHRSRACEQLLQDMAGVQESYTRARLLHQLAPVLPDQLVESALDVLAGCEYSNYVGKALALLSPRLTTEQLQSALIWLRPATDNVVFARAICRLAALLPAAQASAVARRILDLADAVKGTSRGHVVTQVLSLLPIDELPRVLSMLAEERPCVQSVMVITLAGRLRAKDVGAALTFARGIRDAQERAYALAALAREAPVPDAATLYRDALQDAAVPSYSEVFDTDYGDGYQRSDADLRCLAELAREAPDALLPHVVDLAVADPGRSGMITATWDRLDAQQRTAWRQFVQTSSRRFELSIALLHHLPEADRVDLARQLLGELRSVPAQRDYAGAERRKAHLRALLQVIPPSLVPDAQQTAAEILSPDELLGVLPGLTNEQRIALGKTALDAIAHNQWLNSNQRAWRIYDLAPSIPSPVMPQALHMLQELDDGYDRRQALEGLAPHLPAELIAPARDLALGLGNPYDRMKALLALCRIMSDTDRRSVLTVILDEQNMDAQSDVLGDLAPFLPPDQLPAALDALQRTTGAHYQSIAVAMFAETFADRTSRNYQAHWNDSWRTLFSIGTIDRQRFFSLLGNAAAQAIERSMGSPAVFRLIGVLEDVRRWLP